MGALDWINSFTADATVAFRGVVTLILSVVLFWLFAKVKLAVASSLLAGLAYGLALFFLWGGGEWVMTLIRGETIDALGAAVYQLAA